MWSPRGRLAQQWPDYLPLFDDRVRALIGIRLDHNAAANRAWSEVTDRARYDIIWVRWAGKQARRELRWPPDEVLDKVRSRTRWLIANNTPPPEAVDQAIDEIAQAIRQEAAA